MKKLSGFSRVLTLTSILLLAGGLSQAATTYTVVPGGNVTALASSYPVGGTEFNHMSSSFSSATLAGTVSSEVFSLDSANPYGGLTFVYGLTLSPNSAHAASRLTVSSFANFLTDMSFNPGSPAAGGIAPSSFGRSADAQVLRFTFDSPNVLPGGLSALLVVQTDALNYTTGTAAVIDGTSANATAFVPLVPEPTTATLLLVALGGLALRGRRQS